MEKSLIRHSDMAYRLRKTNIQNRNQIVYAEFPHYVYAKSPIEKLNKFFIFVLFILVIVSFLSYYFVSDDEKKMNKLGRDIVSLSNENIELQNKLDNLHSFNKVDDFIKNNSKLDTAKKIIEIPAVNISDTPKIEPLEISYKWSVGY